MVLKVANRGNMPPFIVMDVMQAASLRESKGGDVLHLEEHHHVQLFLQPVDASSQGLDLA